MFRHWSNNNPAKFNSVGFTSLGCNQRSIKTILSVVINFGDKNFIYTEFCAIRTFQQCPNSFISTYNFAIFFFCLKIINICWVKDIHEQII